MGDAMALGCDGITVRFGDTVALDHVSAFFESCRIHAIVGQNGAGKTTLARVIAGLVLPAAGTVTLGGEPIRLGEVVSSRSRGIQMVHQSFALPPSLTVAEALDFGGGRRKGNMFRRRQLIDYWQAYLDDLAIDVDAGRRIRDLPVESRQAIEIARALTTDASILILDEPTAVLRPEAVDALFDRIRSLRDRGVTILMVLHKVREVLSVAETVTVLRGGRVVLQREDLAHVTGQELANAIVGTSVTLPRPDLLAAVGGEVTASGEAATPIAESGPERAEPLLQIREVSTPADQLGVGLDRATFSLYPGEIVGVAGVEGNGQLALVRAIAGLTRPTAGEISISGEDVGRKGVSHRRALGLRVIPFDRANEGLSSTSALWENWALPKLIAKRSKSGVDARDLKKRAKEALDAWGVKYSSVDQQARELSGGNAQKLILAREMDEEAKVVIAAQPTRGLDLGAVEFVWTALRRARDNQAAVLLISSDLDELRDVCDRIVVIVSGAITFEAERPFDLGSIGAALTARTAA